MTSVDIAKQAIEVLNKRGHCHKTWEWEGKVCLLGAVNVALHGDPRKLVGRDYRAADNLISNMSNDRFVLKRSMASSQLTRLFEFNDASSKRSVIALLKRSIKLLS
jgi:hypothetical protein